jgi:hypothetical protein
MKTPLLMTQRRKHALEMLKTQERAVEKLEALKATASVRPPPQAVTIYDRRSAA